MTFLSALILGLLASAHCAGMCGGLQMALQSGSVDHVIVRSRSEALAHLVLLNLGRLITYVIAGVVFASIGYAAISGLNISSNSYWLRFITGFVVFSIGLQLVLGRQRPFQFIEPLGAAIWKPISKLISHNSNRKGQSLITGIAWGFLPCGLVYSVLVLSVFSNDVSAAGLTMLGFGIGTMPSLILTGLVFRRFKEAINHRAIQRVGGSFFIFGGALIISAPYWVSKEFLHGYPELLSMAFCIS